MPDERNDNAVDAETLGEVEGLSSLDDDLELDEDIDLDVDMSDESTSAEEVIEVDDTEEVTIPEWLQSVVDKRRIGVATSFLLTFNIGDYVVQRHYLKSLLTRSRILAPEGFDLVVNYSLSSGITFPDEENESLFRELTGYVASDEEPDEVTMALRKGQEQEPEIPAFPTTPNDCFGLFSQLFGADLSEWDDARLSSVLLFVDNIEMIIPDAPLAQMSPADRRLLMLIRDMAKSDHAMSAGSTIIMTANNPQEVHGVLRQASSRIENVTIPLPSKEVRLDFINTVLKPERPDLFDGDIDEMYFSNLTAGLSKMQIEDIALRAASEGVAINEELVRKRKADIIKGEYQDVIEIIDSNITFADIGGLETIKRYFREDVVDPMRKGEDWRVPLGVMFLGPAGTGKTMIAQAVARESGMNCINLNIAKILDKYVGQSERNFEKALECIKSMEPTIVIVEEIDNVFAGRGGTDGSGVTGRLFKRFLEFMSDLSRRGKSVIIATSNYPSRMDAALKRPGRFDKKIPFFVPDEQARMQIINAIVRRNGFQLGIPFVTLPTGKKNPTPEAAHALRAIADKTNGMTGAELEDIVRKAITYAYKAQRKQVTLDDVVTASEIVMPSTSAIWEMTLEAVRECNDLEFVPAEYQQFALDTKQKMKNEDKGFQPGTDFG